MRAMVTTIEVDTKDVEFIYNQLNLRKLYLTSELEKQSKLGDTFEAEICSSGIQKIDKVLDSMKVISQ